MNRIIFINRFFHPDHSATSQILCDLAFHLAETGRAVHVVTSRQLYDNPLAQLQKRESIRGVNIHRIATTRFGRTLLPGRAIDYLSFYASTMWSLLWLVRRGDVLVAKTDPPMISLPVLVIAKLRGARVVSWLQDIYPEVALQLGVPLLGALAGTASKLRDVSLRASSAVVVVGERMAEFVERRGVAAGKVCLIPNWCDNSIEPVPHLDNPLRREWALEQKFVIGYSGNLGRAHEYNTMLAAAQQLKRDPRIVFLMIGGGKQSDRLAAEVRASGLEQCFKFVPYQSRANLKYSLGAADVHWLSLRPDLEGLIVPSKFYGIAAAARPTIAVVAKDGEIARLVERYQCGVVVEPGNGEAFARAVRRLLSNAAETRTMGEKAREMLAEQFTDRHGFERWKRLLDSLAQPAI